MRALLATLTLLTVALVPPTVPADHDVVREAVTVDSFTFYSALVPRSGSGGDNPTPWNLDTVMDFVITNPTSENATNFQFYLYWGAGVRTTKLMTIPLVPANTTAHYVFHVNPGVGPYWCVSKTYPTAQAAPLPFGVTTPEGGTPYTGFQDGSCQFVRNFQLP